MLWRLCLAGFFHTVCMCMDMMNELRITNVTNTVIQHTAALMPLLVMKGCVMNLKLIQFSCE